MEPSIFLDFNLPNAATWFYFSLILTVALFFQFARVLSLRNLDLLTLFLLVPGFLLLQEAHGLLAAADVVKRDAEALRARAEREVATASALLLGGADAGTATGFALGLREAESVLAVADELDREAAALGTRGQRELVIGYAWLLVGSGYWFARSIADLALVRRPVTSPNLNTPGLGWLGVALLACLTAVAFRPAGEAVVPVPVGARPIPIERVRTGATAVVQSGAGQASAAAVRFWVERSLAMACHLAVVAGLVMIGYRHFQDLTTGMAVGTLYLLLPYTAFHIGQFHLVWPAAFVTWAVFFYRRPAASGWLLGLAAGSAFVPLLLLPLWLGFYSRRGSGRFALSFLTAAAVSLGAVAFALWWDGWLTAGLASANLAEWLPWKRTQAESLWTGVHGAYRLPIFVLFVGFSVGITVWPNPKNLSHLVALSAAVLIGVQFWHADRGGVYVLWYLPLVLLVVFRPNLTGHEPPVEPGGSVMLRWAGAAWRRVRPARPASTSNELAV